MSFLEEKIKTLGTSACPPYHLAIVIGGLSAEQTLKTVKYASARYYDNLHTRRVSSNLMLCAFANAHSSHSGSAGGRAFRDLELEQQVLALTQRIGIGAQFGGKYFCHDVRVIRLPRHGASCPVGIGVSCSADRQALGKITADGVFLEELERDPSKVCEHGGESARLTNVAAPPVCSAGQLTRVTFFHVCSTCRK